MDLSTQYAATRGQRILAGITLAVAALLVWWGAAVTTEDVGLAVPDWPLSFQQLNPEGWWKVPALFLEHGHRLIGMTVALLVAVLFGWIWIRAKHRWWEFVIVAFVYVILVDLARRAGALEYGSPSKWGYWAVLLVFDLGALVWWLRGWLSARWSLPVVLSALAGWAVTNQAIMGGLRVTEMSDAWGILHACVGQSFYALLVWLFYSLFASCAAKADQVGGKNRDLWRRITMVFLGTVFVQLFFGASMRHMHRSGLVASDYPLMNGSLIPEFTDADVVFHFAHRWWAALVLIVALWLFVSSRKPETVAGLFRRCSCILVSLVVVQFALGVSVLLTGKTFWITNFHVITGLAILALALLLAVNARERVVAKKESGY